jgi:hypothetical protein
MELLWVVSRKTGWVQGVAHAMAGHRLGSLVGRGVRVAVLVDVLIGV